MENIYEIIDIEFLDNKIQFIIDEYENIWISVEQICEHLNIDLDWYMQALVDLADLGYNVCTFKVFDSDGEKYDVFMIHINSIKAWLNAIRFNDIKFEFRGILTRYREEIVDFVMNAIVDFDTISVFGNETVNNNMVSDEMVSDENKTIENVIEKGDTQNIELGRRIDDNKYEAIEIFFYGGIIELVEDENNNIWVNVKKICDMFGISYYEQHIKLESIDWKNWVVWKIVNKQFMINLDCFKDWLLKIEPNIISLKSRHILVKYQKEIDSDIIRKVFREEIEGGNKNKKVDKADFYVSKTKKIKKLKKDIDDNYKCYVVDIGSNNKKVEVVRDGNGGIWIYTNRICKILGIDYRNHMMKLASKDWANWKIIFAVHNNGKKHKWFMLHIDCFDKWINSIKKNILKTKDNMSWGDFVEIKKYSYMIKKAVDRAIREENTTVVEEHFEGEELVGRAVYETDEEEIDESKDVVKRDTLEEDEEQIDGEVKRPPIEEKEEKMKAEGVKMQEIVSYPFYFEDEIVITFIYEGRPCWIAKDIGNILGYARDGGSLIHIIKDWSRSKNDFINKGDDYVILTGKELKQFKETARSVSSYSARLMLIFKGGLELVCDRQNNSVGRKLKEFLIEEVLPRIGKSEEKKIEKDTEEEKIEAITTSCKEEGADIIPVKEKTYQVVDVDFYGGTIEAVLDENGDIWASVRRTCEHLGIAPWNQQLKLKDQPWACTMIIMVHDTTGRIQESFMLNLDSFAGWLFTIHASKVKPECRELLVMYQKEAAKVLRDHFFGNRMQPFVGHEIPSYPDTLRAYADLLEKNSLLVIERDGAISEAKHQSYLANNMAMRLESKKEAISIGEKLVSSKGGLTIDDFGNAVKINGKAYGSGKMRELLKRWGVFTKDDKKPRNYHLRERQWFEVNVDFYIDEDGIKNQLSCIVITTKGQRIVLLKMSNDVEFEDKSIVFDGEEYNGQGSFSFKNKTVK
jgi:prophage antirepressor-like protein